MAEHARDAVDAREGQEGFQVDRTRLGSVVDTASGREAHGGVSVYAVEQESLDVAVACDEQQWQAQAGLGG